MAPGTTIDWERIEADYRAGMKTLRVIAEEHGLTHGAINKRAKRDNWTRDLSAKIQQAARDKVSKAQVSSLVSKTTERDVIDANSNMIADKIIEHRTDIPKKRALVAKLFAEIEAMTDGKELMETVTLALEAGDADGLASAVKKLCTLPQRIKGVTELMNAYKSVIGLERQAFGMADGEDIKADALADLIKTIQGNRVDLVRG